MDDYMKHSQDAANEIWSVILRRDYPSPGAKKRAIEHQIRAALESALGLPSTVDGWEEGRDPLYGEATSRPQRNPYAGATP